MFLDELAKEHEKLFPKATAESQFWKLEEEIKELADAITREQQIKELADIVIVCGGLFRWFPATASAIKYAFYDLYNEYTVKVDEEVNRKWQVNLNRKWEWNGKTYKHKGKDGNE